MFALAFSPDGSRLAASYTSEPGGTAEYPAGWRAFSRADRPARGAGSSGGSIWPRNSRLPGCSSRRTAARSA